MGLKLEDYFKAVEECLDAITYAIDDGCHFYNNYTSAAGTPQWFGDPLVNLTRMISTNVSEATNQCYLFGKDAYYYVLEVAIDFDNSIGDYLLAFLFNQMGNALAFKDIFD